MKKVELSVLLLVVMVILGSCAETMRPYEPFAEEPTEISIEKGNSVQAHYGVCSAGTARVPDAGVEILTQGGNAFDGAAAALLMVGTGEQTFGLEVPIIFYDAKKKETKVLSGQGPAPALATWQYFYDNFEDHKIPTPGGGVQNAAVPGLLLACLTMIKDKGTMSFEQVAQPMLGYLKTRDGYQLRLAGTIEELIEAEKKALAAGGDRVDGITAVRDYFYNGPVADKIEDWMIENGGLIRKSDMVAYAKNWTPYEDTVSTDYKGYTVHKCDTWTQGPYMLQTMNILEGFDLAGMGHNSADYIHTFIEAMKLGFADRDMYFADPEFAEVPLKPMMSQQYADLRRSLIDMQKASHEMRPGNPANMNPLIEAPPMPDSPAGPDNDTTTCIVADRWGNVVVCTPSGWGDIRTDIGDTGVRMGSRLISFKSGPGNENHPNVIEPGKRPAITLTPTLVTKDGKPVIGICVAGGDQQDQCAMNILLNLIEFGMTPDVAVTAPRVATEQHVNWFYQTPPNLGVLNFHTAIDEAIRTELEARGHTIKTHRGAMGSPSIVVIDYENRILWGAGDRAARRNVAGY
ncbi:gamma-glutamyltransferase family protein [Planctomycetota bacterium]